MTTPARARTQGVSLPVPSHVKVLNALPSPLGRLPAAATGPALRGTADFEFRFPTACQVTAVVVKAGHGPPPQRIVLDIDDTFDRVHGRPALCLFNAYYDDYGFQPIVVFDEEGRFVTALPSASEVRDLPVRLAFRFDEVRMPWRRGGAHCARCGHRATRCTLSNAYVEPVVMA